MLRGGIQAALGMDALSLWDAEKPHLGLWSGPVSARVIEFHALDKTRGTWDLYDSRLAASRNPVTDLDWRCFAVTEVNNNAAKLDGVLLDSNLNGAKTSSISGNRNVVMVDRSINIRFAEIDSGFGGLRVGDRTGTEQK